MKTHKRILACLTLCAALLSACAGPTNAPKNSGAGNAANTGNAGTPAATEATAQEGTATPEDKPGAPEPVTLQFLAPSPVSEVNGFADVLAEFEKRTKDTLNIKINYTFTTFDDIGQKVSLKLSSGEQLDCAFVAQWTNPTIMQMISKGMLTNLDPYFKNDAYPGLKAMFDDAYIANNSFADANGEYHLYAVPFAQSFTGGNAIYYRLDLAKKYGMNEIKSYEDLIKFFDAVLANDPGVTPFAHLGSNDALSAIIAGMVNPTMTEKHNSFESSGVSVAIKPDGTCYVARSVVPRMDPEYQKLLTPPFDTLDPLNEHKLAREWYVKGYVEKDVLSQKDHEGQFVAGRAASFTRALDTYAMIAGRLKASLPDSELGVFITDPGIAKNTPKINGSDFKAWNFAAIPATSKNADRTMAFLNWIFEDRANHDLFELGIEGKHWEAVGEDQYKIPEGTDANAQYNFPGYLLTWNPNMVRYDSQLPRFAVDALKQLADTDFFYKRPDAGFSFVTDAIKTEQAKINDLASLMRSVSNGVVEDIEGTVADIQKQYDQAGYAKICEEFERQFNAYLKDNPYQGQ